MTVALQRWEGTTWKASPAWTYSTIRSTAASKSSRSKLETKRGGSVSAGRSGTGTAPRSRRRASAIASAARSYWEAYGPDAPAASQQPLPPTAIPFGFTTFPGEIWKTPRSWVEASYPNVIYFNAVDKGGHFAAWEEPELFSEELRAAFASVR